MSPPPLRTLIEALARHQLLDPAQVDGLARECIEAGIDLVAFARELVRHGWVTPYQLQMLCSGRGSELVLGQYVILDLLGVGGMGQVFRARHRRLDRVDALKVIRPEHVASPNALRRFLREARAAARLSHPNIVRVHDADEANGTHFLAMEYVPGIDLAALVKEVGPLPAGFACWLTSQAAVGLQHAHERGLVHRDIKPANLLLPQDLDGIKILDMGLARLHPLEEGSELSGELTHDGVVMGTPDYIAPEQAADSHTVDIRADIYSLGCTFYFLLTGASPCPPGTPMKKLLWHQQQMPAPIESRRPDLPAGLPEICHRALAKKPEERFQTPADLAAALEPYANAAADAEPPGSGRATLACIQAAARQRLSGIEELDFGFLQSADHLGLALQDTIAPTDRVTGPPAPLSASRDEGTASQAAPRTDVPNPLGTALYLGSPAGPPTPSGTSRDPSDADTIRKKKKGPRRARRRRGGDTEKDEPAPRDLTASILGGLLLVAIVGGLLWFSRTWHTDTGSTASTIGLIRTLEGHTDIIHGVTFAPDGHRAVSCGKDRTVRVWDLETGGLEARLEGFGDSINAVAWSPTDDLILLGGRSAHGRDNPPVLLWDINPAKTVRQFRLEGHTTSVVAVGFSPDGKWALTGGGLRNEGDLALRLWSVAERRQVGQLIGHEDFVFRMTIAPNGKQAASCSNDGTVRLWDIESRKEIHCFRPEGGRTLCLAFSPDGRSLAAGGEDRNIRIWDVETRQETTRLAGHGREVFGVAFLPDNRRLVSAGADRSVRIWDREERRELQHFDGHTDVITSLAVSPDGTRAVTGSADRSVRLWGLPR